MLISLYDENVISVFLLIEDAWKKSLLPFININMLSLNATDLASILDELY